jgi:hypothetical protein
LSCWAWWAQLLPAWRCAWMPAWCLIGRTKIEFTEYVFRWSCVVKCIAAASNRLKQTLGNDGQSLHQGLDASTSCLQAPELLV